MPKMTHAQKLIHDLNRAFEYTNDNNRDLLDDPSFPMQQTAEELTVQFCFQYLIATIARDPDLINSNMSDD